MAPGAADRAAGPTLSLPWWQLAGLFAVAGVFVFHVEIDNEAHTFSLSEVPLALGLFFTRPGELVLSRLVGEAFVLVVLERQTLTKLLFNLGVFFAESVLALAIFRAVGGGNPLQLHGWLDTLLALGAAALAGAIAVWAVIRMHGGQVNPRQLGLAASVTVLSNTSLAAVAAVLLVEDRTALLPLLVVAGVIVAAYRGYTRLTKRYDGLELLYQFTRITSDHQNPDEILDRVLRQASALLRARRALIVLHHPDQGSPWLSLATSVTQTGSDQREQPLPTEPDPESIPALVRDQVLLRGESLLIPRTTADPSLRAVLQALGAQDCLAAPLLTGGRISGLLLVADRLGQVSTFDHEDERLFATLASQAAIALENGRLIERLHEQVSAREHEALHDALTGLPNRTLFARHLSRVLAEPEPGIGAVLLMDLDGFKEVNDTLGHQTGDQLLQEVARRLRQTVAQPGLVARLGGDEFAVLLPQLPERDDGAQVAAQAVAALRQPMRLASLALEVGVSVGVALWPDHGADLQTLLQRADVAMYNAKRARAGVAVYDPDADNHSQRRLRLAGELRAAVGARQIQVHYQPIARAAGGQVIAAEALARWDHPDLGRIGPDDFIPIAERTGLIHDLTLYVLEDALGQLRTWQAAGLQLEVAVNLSAQVLRDLDWPAKVAQLLHAYGTDPRQLTLEITETGIMSDPARMTSMLHDLAATGISFAVDDFGTGYSSLAYLQQLPVSKLKIDKSFVGPMNTDPAAATIVRSVVDLAHSLGLTAIAEGVEDQRTLDHLLVLECPLVQGYYLSRPIPAAEFTAWITRRLEPPSRADLPALHT